MSDRTTAASSSDLSWRKSRHSGAVGNCVELAPLAGSRIAVRDSWQPAGPILVYPRAGLAAFVTWVKTHRTS